MSSVYEMVTERIISEMEKGIIPWQRPWIGSLELDDNVAFSRFSKKPYSLLNQMLLEKSGEYGSFKQWKSIGGSIKKGAKSEIVVFWKMSKIEEKTEDEDGKEKIITRTVPILRYYNVFHISQVENVEPIEIPKKEHKTIAEAENIISDYVARENLNFNETASNEAFYSPLKDMVVVPLRTQFENIEEFYSTTFHELIHSTGHVSRLNRIDSIENAAFGSKNYSKEELVAEIGAASIVNQLGMETEKSFKNSTAYIESWLQVLKNDTRMIVTAASKAEKAGKYLLNIE